ncbi:MAG: hypothetical protein CYPHOPRED_003623 [Cyphobasidiales sp. Tagirdzhanova-0007]|nr:MAG: hypothetical protein CYPHOPRED_003623 [Cyphobasidiales sp. Tagirdzhanova-0007]
MSHSKSGTASDFNGFRQSGAEQESKMSKLDYQELLETRVLSSAGVRHSIKHASLFDRDDNLRVASDAESFELPTEEVVDIQDRIMAAAGAVGALKTPVKVQGKEYALKSLGDDTMVATAEDGETIVAALTASLVLVILTASDQVDAIKTIAQSFSEGLSNQAI